MSAMTDEQKRFGISQEQIDALAQLILPPSFDSNLHLTFNIRELNNVGAAFMQLVELGYAERKKIASGWYKFAITPEGKKKWKQVQREQTR